MAVVLVCRLESKGLMHGAKLRPVEVEFKPLL